MPSRKKPRLLAIHCLPAVCGGRNSGDLGESEEMNAGIAGGDTS